MHKPSDRIEEIMYFWIRHPRWVFVTALTLLLLITALVFRDRGDPRLLMMMEVLLMSVAFGSGAAMAFAERNREEP